MIKVAMKLKKKVEAVDEAVVEEAEVVDVENEERSAA